MSGICMEYIQIKLPMNHQSDVPLKKNIFVDDCNIQLVTNRFDRNIIVLFLEAILHTVLVF